jgi:hypothetical protein
MEKPEPRLAVPATIASGGAPNRKAARNRWAALIKQVHEVDPLRGNIQAFCLELTAQSPPSPTVAEKQIPAIWMR